MYALDESILDVDVCAERLVIIDHTPSSDQQLFTLQGTSKEMGGEREGLNSIQSFETITYAIHDFMSIL